MCHITSEMSTSLHAGFAEAISPRELALYAVCFGSGSLLGLFDGGLCRSQPKASIKCSEYFFNFFFLFVHLVSPYSVSFRKPAKRLSLPPFGKGFPKKSFS